jgi:hypothetical protein
MIERVSLEKQKKFYNELANYKYKCRCGHVVLMLRGTDKKLCSWCHHYIYKDKRDEFKDRLRSILNG